VTVRNDPAPTRRAGPPSGPCSAPSPLHHVVDGPPDAPVLLMGASLGTTTAMWDPQVDALARHLRVVRFDHRGHGGSPVPPGPYTIGHLARDVLRLLDDLHVAHASVAGLSLGGMVGMALAAYAPERVDRLALVCTSAHMPPAQAWHERAAAVRRDGTAALADGALGRWFTPAFAAERPDVTGRFATMLADTPDEGYAACCEAIAAMDLRDRLGDVRAPTLVVAGADDPATPPEHAHTIAEAVTAGGGAASVAVVPDAAHLAGVEQPEAVTSLLLAHLTG
jgi:3-oxoadipate enol-lactonase